MKKLSILMVGAFLLAAIAGCSFGTATLSRTAIASGPAFQAGYRTIVVQPGAQGELALGTDPSVMHGYFLAKTALGFDKTQFEHLGASVAGDFDLDGFTYWQLKKSSGLTKLVFDLRSTRGVIWAEPELKTSLPPDESASSATANSISRGATAESAVFNDPSAIADEYALEITKALDSYKPTTDGGNGYGDGDGIHPIYVAQIDTGVNMKHYDFYDGLDGTGTGIGTGNSLVAYAKSAFDFTDKVNGTFTWVGDGSPLVSIPIGENWDDVDHGTHTAGTILARGNNKIGSAGIAWKNTRLISYKCFCDNEINRTGSGADWSVYGSLKDLTDWWKVTANHPGQTTVPVNMSLGGSYAGNFELEMINYALANNVLPIVSMGNEGQVKAQYPASYSGVIAVGATNGRDEKVAFSSMGSWISVAAPGFDIISTSNGANGGPTGWNNSANPDLYTGTVWMSGTSMAAPFVTGLVGYMLSFDPTLAPDQVKAVLQKTADDKGTPGFDDSFGYGRVDVEAAAAAVRTGNVPAAGTVFVPTAIKVSVHNTNANYNSGIGGYTDAVIGQLVTLYDQSGEAIALGNTNGRDGSVEFRLLTAGTYTTKTNYFGNYQEATVSIDNSADQPISFTFNVPILLIQTVPNLFWPDGANTAADTMITVYDATGTNIVVGPYDWGTLDTLTVANLPRGSYFVQIQPYDPVNSLGEYGLNVGYAAVGSINVNPGRVENVDDVDGNVDAAHAKPITLGTNVAEYLGPNGEWFSFVMP